MRGLRKAYGDVVAVDGIDLEAHPGECLGLLGPNGAGKTTTIEICEGLTPADSGVVELFGLRWETSARELRQRIGVQLQETQLSERLTVEEHVPAQRDPTEFIRGSAAGQQGDACQGKESRTRRQHATCNGSQRTNRANAWTDSHAH